MRLTGARIASPYGVRGAAAIDSVAASEARTAVSILLTSAQGS